MRERLAEHYQETHCFTAFFLTYSKTAEGSNVACFRHVFIGENWVADHTWIHRSKAMKRLELKSGDIVQFQARVDRYSRNAFRQDDEVIEYDFCLAKIQEFVVLKRHEEVLNES